jgi:hypothetical protein
MAVVSSASERLGFWPFGPTSANVSGRALQVLDFINSLHRQIMASAVSEEFKETWGGFYRVAANYLVVAVRHPIALSTEDVQGRIEGFARQALEWRTAFEGAGGQPVGPAIHPETPAETKVPGWIKWLVAAGAVGGGLYLASWVVRYTRFKEWAYKKSFPGASSEEARDMTKQGYHFPK